MTSVEFYQYVIHFAVMMTVLTLMAVYLLVSKRNAFGSEIVTDQRLRRKAGWMILIYVLVYLANIPLCFWLSDNQQLLEMVSVTLDMMVTYPTVLYFMLELLQDRRRWDNRLWWLSLLAVMPLAGWLLTHWSWWIGVLYGLYLTELVTFIVWYVRATKAYHRFLADNYADLEHKELVWSWMILSSIFLSTINYLLTMFQSDMHTIVVCTYAIHAADTIFIALIVWHIDCQQVLEPQTEEWTEEVLKSQEAMAMETESMELGTMETEAMEPETMETEAMETTNTQEVPASRKDIIIYKTGELLRKYCEEAQLYLQRDLSLKTLAQACHTNRTYLGLYFASQGITYYIYINKLRIDHFQSLYREAMKEESTTFTLQQLSKDSGFLSYNTFSRAFVSCTGISVSKWQEQVNLEG